MVINIKFDAAISASISKDRDKLCIFFSDKIDLASKINRPYIASVTKYPKISRPKGKLKSI